jgi:ABC-type multidrug transport system ATPase subunit
MACNVFSALASPFLFSFLFLYHLPFALSLSSLHFNPTFCPGKSTLLDILSMRKNSGKVTGKLKVAGREETGYVEQFDTLVGELSVEEMLRYTSELLCCDLTREQRVSRVNDIISRLDLEKVRNNTIGRVLKRGISGGEAKRLNIGIALVPHPKVLNVYFLTLPFLL